ncbi:sugar ABC transporter substrate-binding protein [Cohnella pontilimi]|uniref:Sugar ABC transporter substrate-binding protein n=1 Tax=Cohnella pontilimi TaxID=2564100 RepID=A0A4U0FBX2_9BACL|nr:sugar ABC transporter substrate-binding protein [Cohnella pontilimi]TJY42285.1 sugar ABC transporter substrate-binding protein [Cohnella pontilimi]
MKTKTTALLLALFLSVSLLYGCSKGKSNNAASSGDTGSSGGDKVTIEWLVRTDPNMIDWEKDMIAGFQKDNPNITVKLTTIPQAEIDQRLTTMISSGKVPDVWSPNWANSGFASYMKMGALKDMTSFIERDSGDISTINQQIMDIYKIDNKTYGIPMLAIGSFLFYNKELFDKDGVPYPPTDWNDTSWNYDAMLQKAQKLTHDVGNANKQVFGVLNSMSPNLQTWGFGGDMFKPEAYTSAVMGEPAVLTNPQNKEALQFNVDLIQKHKVAPNQATVDAVSAVGDPFLTGKVAMVINGGWGFWAYGPAKFKWGVAPIPYHDGRKVPLFVDPWCISEKSKHPEESWKFIKYLVDPNNGGKKFMEKTSATPADTSLADQWYQQMADKTGMKVEEVKQLNEGAVQNGREADNHLIDKFAVISTTINQTANSLWNGQKSVDQGLQEIDKNLRSLKF